MVDKSPWCSVTETTHGVEQHQHTCAVSGHSRLAAQTRGAAMQLTGRCLRVMALVCCCAGACTAGCPATAAVAHSACTCLYA